MAITSYQGMSTFKQQLHKYHYQLLAIRSGYDGYLHITAQKRKWQTEILPLCIHKHQKVMKPMAIVKPVMI